MALVPVPVTIKLDSITCYDNGEIGSAEPYMWTALFKIDGDTVSVNSSLQLEGTATVLGSLGDHGDLGPGGVNNGDDVPIPAGIGDWSTTLTPIPVSGFDPIDGVVGIVVVLLEQDDTSDEAVAAGHAAFNQAIQSALDDLIPTLNMNNQSPSASDIQALTNKVGAQVQNAIASNVSWLDWLGAVGNMDDQIGASVFFHSQTELCRSPVTGFILAQTWNDSGKWSLSGRMRAVIDELEVSCIHKPIGNSTHIDTLGGTVLGVRWRLSNEQVMEAITENDFPFFVTGADGSRSRVIIGKHAPSAHNPSGTYLLTTTDASKEDNLLSLPTCTALPAD